VAAPLKTQLTGASMTEKANILMVDDQPSRLLTYETILESLNQNLVRAQSGTEALQHLMRADFAAILLDVSMPDMDGFETAAMIHQHPRFEKTPIIFVTAVHVTDMDRLRGYQMGAVDYVYVPVVPEILRGKVQVLVELYLQRRELQRLNLSLALANRELTEAHQALQAENMREVHALNMTLAQANSELERSNRALKTEIAERERAQEALQTEARRKDEFLAMLAHELRNPLSAIHNGVQLMHQRNVTDAKLIWVRDVLGRQVSHLTRLIDDLLDVSRIGTGLIQLQREAVDIAVVVGRAVEATQPLMETRRHRLLVDTPEESLWVDGDAVRLTQVFDNLLSNAAKYTDQYGSLQISVERGLQGDVPAAIVRVRDNGVGIPPQMLERIFDLFTQANPTFDGAQSGLGIGLALVRGLVQLHGGEVRAASEGAGQGSEFTVSLPLLNDAQVPVSDQSQVALDRPRVTALSILVVDDNVDSTKGLALWLESAGHKVQVAHAGDVGLKKALKLRPNAILLDIGLPVLSGYEVASRLREHEAFKTTPLIAMSGYGDKGDRERALLAGFNHYLVKPIDYETLAIALSTLGRAVVIAE
jgi:signal transduction histidine kinase